MAIPRPSDIGSIRGASTAWSVADLLGVTAHGHCSNTPFGAM
jgi:hypothetical protein